MNGTVTPRSFSEAAAALAGAAAQGRPVRIVGGSTKLGWGGSVTASALRLSTELLGRVFIADDNPDVATLGAGTNLAAAQTQLARRGRMLAIDPQLGLGTSPGATVGGVLATADSGPLAHRYGPPAEQLIGITLARSDGTVVRAGSRAEERYDGYDLPRLCVGAFGTLGVILSVDVRLHPLPSGTATALGSTEDPEVLRDAAIELTRACPDLQALDVSWREGGGGLLAQAAGPDAEAIATMAASTMLACGLYATAVSADDASVWARQRAGQRSPDRAVLRVSAPRSQLDVVVRIADAAQASLVGRAGLGISYLTLNVNQIATVRQALPRDTGNMVLDLPQSARGAVDPWGISAGPELDLMRSIKLSFDAADICNPGIYPGGL